MNAKISLAALLAGLLVACSTAPTAEDGTEREQVPQEEVSVEEEETDFAETLEAIAAGEHRSEANRARDQYRNPVETLTFFGLQPDQTVVELSPGRGWYTEILAPALAEEGELVVGMFAYDESDTESYFTQIALEYIDLLEANRELFGDVTRGTFAPPEVVEIGEPESADLVLTFRNIHSWHNRGILEPALEAVYEVLKPGGVFGVVAHRAEEGSDVQEVAPTGYLPQEFVIAVIEEAGFVLEESSEINANPDDTRDHEHGVWSLPPTLRGGEEDAERFQQIGESDRMTLRFVKP